MQEVDMKDDFAKETEKQQKIKYQELKLKLEKFQNGKKWKYALIAGAVSGIIFLLLDFTILILTEEYSTYKIIGLVGVTILVMILAYIYAYCYLDMQENSIRRRMLEYETGDIQESVQNDVFENSIKMSYKYLDQYYLQIRDQAQKGFFVTVCVSVFGAILIGVGIVLMFMDITNPSYITCASGVITEFIATIFFYMYNKTVTSMSKYHNKLVLSHNISIALKVADTLPEEDKVKSKNLIISELLKDMNSHLIISDSEDAKK